MKLEAFALTLSHFLARHAIGFEFTASVSVSLSRARALSRLHLHAPPLEADVASTGLRARATRAGGPLFFANDPVHRIGRRALETAALLANGPPRGAATATATLARDARAARRIVVCFEWRAPRRELGARGEDEKEGKRE